MFTFQGSGQQDDVVDAAFVTVEVCISPSAR
jgi:hypothetical protein